MTLTNCSTKTIDFHPSWRKNDDVRGYSETLMSDVKLWCDTGDNMLVFRHMRALLFTASSVGILLASALCGPPMPKTSNPSSKLGEASSLVDSSPMISRSVPSHFLSLAAARGRVIRRLRSPRCQLVAASC